MRLWLSAAVLLSMHLASTCSALAQIVGQEIPLSARQADFKTFVADFEDNYAYLGVGDKPWLSWQSRYAQAVEQAATKEAYAGILASALGELHDFHAEVRSPVTDRWLPVPTFSDIWSNFTVEGAVVQSVRAGSDAQRAGIHAGDTITKVDKLSLEDGIKERLGNDPDSSSQQARQWALLSVLTGRSDDPRTLTLKSGNRLSYTVNLPVKRRIDRKPGSLAAEILPGNIGYIRFNNSLGEQSTVTAFDKVLGELGKTAGLVLDLRDVPSGGNSSVALGIMGRFVTQLFAYQRHRIPNYGQFDVERNWVEFVAPRGPFTYDAPVAVLVGHWTGSMGEGLAVGFDAMHRGVVVGTAMAHLAGAVSEDKLPKTGIVVAYATEQIYHVDGTPRQSWLPSISVVENDSRSDDAVLNRGLLELGKLKETSPEDLRLSPPK